MTAVIGIRARSKPAPEIVSLASRPALAWQALVEARKAEGEGRPAEAAGSYELTVRLAAPASGGASPLLASARAAAQAGLARLNPTHPEADQWRKAALAWLRQAPEEELDAAGIADHALLLKVGDPLRTRLVAQATTALRPPAFLALNSVADITDPRTRYQLARSGVRESPMVPQHHVLLASTDGRGDQDRSADYTVAAALFLAAGNVPSAREAAAAAHRLEPANSVAMILLADILRLAGEAGDSVSLLSSLSQRPDLSPELRSVTSRVLARALELDGRRQHAIEAIAEVLDQADVLSDDLLFAADVRTLQGDFSGARDALDRALAVDPSGLPAVTASARYWLRAMQPARATADVQRALQSVPVNPCLCVLLGYVRAQTGSTLDLEEQIRHAGELGLDAADAWAYASSLYEDQSDLRAAADTLGTALKLRPDDPEFLARQGQILLRTGDFKRAIKVLRRCIKQRSSDAEPYRWLAQAYLSAGYPEKAKTVLDDAIGSFADDGSLIALRGEVLRRLGDLAAAERDLRSSLGHGLNPSWATQLFLVLCDRGGERSAAAALAECVTGKIGTVAVRLWDDGNRTGATAVAEAGLRAAAGSYSAAEQARLFMTHGLGQWLVTGRGDPEASLRDAVAVSPGYAEAHAFLACYLAETGHDTIEAVAEVRIARGLAPGSERVALLAADVLRIVEGDASALAELDDAIRQIGEDHDLLVVRAELLALTGQAEAALMLLAGLREQGIAGSRLARAEGIALTGLGRYLDAISVLRAVLEQDPGDAEARLGLAFALNEAGESPQAAEVLEAIDEDAVDARVLTVRGSILHSLRDKASLRYLSAALDRDPGQSDARIELVDAAVEFGEYDLAGSHFSVLRDDRDLEADSRVVRLAWLLGETDVALDRVQHILALAETGRPSITGDACASLIYRSAILLERGDVAAAIEAARSAEKLDETNPDVRYVLSAALMAAGSPGEALAVLGSENDRRLVIQRVELLLDMGRRSQAVRLVRRTVQTERTDDRLTAELLDTLTGAGLLLQVARIIEPCLTPQASPWILRSAGKLLSAMGEFPRAARVFERVRKMMRWLPDVDSSLAWVYSNFATAQPDEVLKAANRALRKQPDDLYMVRSKADALMNIGQSDRAIRLYRDIRNKVSVPWSYDGSLAGWCSYRLGDYERALDDLLRGISASPEPTAPDLFDLGLVFFAAGRPARAKREYTRAIETCRALPSPLERHGILQVAIVDLNDALGSRPATVNHETGEQLKQMLRRQLVATQVSFAPVRDFLGSVDKLIKPRRQHSNGT